MNEKRYTAIDVTDNEIITEEDILHNACCFSDWSGHIKVVVDNTTGEIVYAQGITLRYNEEITNSKGQTLVIATVDKEAWERKKHRSKLFATFCEHRFWEER